MNNSTCAGCQTVVGCQANPKVCPNLTVPTAENAGNFQVMRFRSSDHFTPVVLSSGPVGDLTQWFQGPLPEIGDECSYVCIGRTSTSVSMAWVTRQHLNSLKGAK